MRTSIRKSLCLALTLVALTSCGKGFLDEQPSQLPSGDQLKEAGKKSEDISLGFVNGVVSSFFKALQSTGGSHDDFAQKAFDISADLMSGDMEMRQSNYRSRLYVPWPTSISLASMAAPTAMRPRASRRYPSTRQPMMPVSPRGSLPWSRSMSRSYRISSRPSRLSRAQARAVPTDNTSMRLSPVSH